MRSGTVARTSPTTLGSARAQSAVCRPSRRRWLAVI